MSPSLPSRASYDDDGNVILPGDKEQIASGGGELNAAWTCDDASEKIVKNPVPEVTQEKGIPWELIESPEEDLPKSDARSPAGIHVDSVQHETRSTLKEGWRQYQTTFEEARVAMVDAEAEATTLLHRTWLFMTKPIGRRERPRKSLPASIAFFVDVVRFGGTFAGIFLLLFVSLNYQSFWQIAKANITPLISPQSMEQGNLEDAALQGSLQSAPMKRTSGDLIAALPQIGPPRNMLIIPKLKLTVPIVTPPTDALLRQDWPAVEKQIQASLEKGVVHYPGTAKAGQAGNFFITGHSSFYAWSPGMYKSVFARLHELSPGDEYWIYYNGDKHRYTVRSKKEVSPSDVTVLDQPPDERISTLMTCTPLGTTLRRLIIVAQEVDISTGIALHVGERTKRPEMPRVAVQNLPI